MKRKITKKISKIQRRPKDRKRSKPIYNDLSVPLSMRIEDVRRQINNRRRDDGSHECTARVASRVRGSGASG